MSMVCQWVDSRYDKNTSLCCHREQLGKIAMCTLRGCLDCLVCTIHILQSESRITSLNIMPSGGE